MSNYWADRMAAAQTKLTEKTTKQVEAQLRKYYKRSMEQVINDFEATYNKLLNTVAHDREPTPADLYKIDKYWKMQGQMQEELRKLGSRQVSAMAKAFEANYFDVYYSIGIEGLEAFNTIDRNAVKQVINSIWCADGKSWSARIWENTSKLAQALNDELINCIVSGKKSSDLKKMLQERFSVSYSAADSLVRTELAHIQTEAAKQRYTDYGIQMVEIWADKDERRCEVCGKLHQTKYPVGAAVPIPAHPRCRCCIVPVVESKELQGENKQEQKIVNKFGKEIDIDKRFNDEKWKESIDIIKKLSNEYDTRLSSVKIGSINSAGSVDMGGNMYLSSRKPETALHEFAHSLTQKDLTKYGVENQKEFWQEIEKIKRAYRKEAGDNPLKWLSSYEHSTNKTDEFLAEAFTQAKAKEFNITLPDSYGKDDKYSKEVLAVIDKYFKKKRK